MELSRRGFLKGLFGAAAVGVGASTGAAPYTSKLVAEAAKEVTGASYDGIWMYRSMPKLLPDKTTFKFHLDFGPVVPNEQSNFAVRTSLLGRYSTVITVGDDDDDWEEIT